MVSLVCQYILQASSRTFPCIIWLPCIQKCHIDQYREKIIVMFELFTDGIGTRGIPLQEVE